MESGSICASAYQLVHNAGRGGKRGGKGSRRSKEAEASVQGDSKIILRRRAYPAINLRLIFPSTEKEDYEMARLNRKIFLLPHSAVKVNVILIGNVFIGKLSRVTKMSKEKTLKN